MRSTFFVLLSLPFLSLVSAQRLSPTNAADKGGVLAKGPIAEGPDLKHVGTGPSGGQGLKHLGTGPHGGQTTRPDPLAAVSVGQHDVPSARLAAALKADSDTNDVHGHHAIGRGPSKGIPDSHMIRTGKGETGVSGHDSRDGQPGGTRTTVEERDTPREDHGPEMALARAMRLKLRLVAHQLEVNDMAGHEIAPAKTGIGLPDR